MFGKKKEQSVETNGIVYRRAKTWRVALAGCSSGIGMCFYVLLGLASYVANEGYGIATAVVGIILTATRILDGVTDPIIAIIIDKMNTRFGKIRILMVAGWLIESLAVLIMYCWASGKGHGIVLFVLLQLARYYFAKRLQSLSQRLGSKLLAAVCQVRCCWISDAGESSIAMPNTGLLS